MSEAVETAGGDSPVALKGPGGGRAGKQKVKERFYDRFSAPRLTTLRAMAKRSHRYRAYRFLTISFTLATLFAIPLLELARFDLYGGEHVVLRKTVAPLYGFAAVVVTIFSAFFLTFNVNLVAGRMFCGWGCPVGQLNRLTDTFVAAKDLKSKLTWGGILGAYVVLLVTSVALWWTSPSVFTAWPWALVALAAIAMLTATALVFGRLWGWAFCRKVCPIGLYYSVVQQKRPLGILYEKSKCLEEMSCVKACPVLLDPRDMAEQRNGIGGFALEGLPANNHCLRCGACVEACDIVTFKTGAPALRFGRPAESVEPDVRIEALRPSMVGAIPAMADAATLATTPELPREPDESTLPLAERLRKAWPMLMIGALLLAAIAFAAITLGAKGYKPKQTWAEEDTPARPYVASAGTFASGTIEGKVTIGGQGIAGAVVYVDRPAPGLAARAPGELRIVFGADGKKGYDRAIYVASPHDKLELENASHEIHTYSVARRGAVIRSVTLPGGRVEHPTMQAVGAYELTCSKHPDERARLVVVDHPYTTTTGADGTFQLVEVPAGKVAAVVVAPELVFGQHVDVPAGAAARVDLTGTIEAK
ncbi:4Fe-4S dicluster domain-containing protein [Myxococcota bacterium]|nr:4Fe-4S dicluster domain-containing protein [Myxococcota bacterium]